MSHTLNIQAFDAEMLAALHATGSDMDKVAASYQAELEKIAALNPLQLIGRFGRGIADAATGTAGAVARGGKALVGGAKGAGGAVGGAGQKAKAGVGDLLTKGKEHVQAGWNKTTRQGAMASNRIAEGVGTSNKATKITEGVGQKNGVPGASMKPDGSRPLDRVALQRAEATSAAKTQAAAKTTDTAAGANAATPGATPPAPAPPTAPGTVAPNGTVVPGTVEEGGIAAGIKKHLGLDVTGGTAQFGPGWTKKLTDDQRIKLLGVGGAGVVGSGAVAGLGAAALSGGGGGQTVVYT